MIQRLIALVLLAQIAIPSAFAAELPVRRIDALRALIASQQDSVADADTFLKTPVSPAQATDVSLPQDIAAVSVGVKRGWLMLNDRTFHPNEALSIDDAIQWRMRATGLGAAVTSASDRQMLSNQEFMSGVNQLRDYKWTISPAYKPGDYVSLPDARALFATATGVILPANPVEYPHGDLTYVPLVGNLLGSVPTVGGGSVSSIPTVGVSDSSSSWWPFPNVRVAVIDGLIQRTLGISNAPMGNAQAAGVTTETLSTPSFLASVTGGVSETLGDPWQSPMPTADDSVIAAPAPVTDADGNVLASVRGLDIAKYVSAKSFAITMPSLDIADLAIEHPADPTTSAGLLEPLQRGVGHLFSYPGEGGTVLVYGHSSNYPWDVSGFAKIFRQINKLKVGDQVYVTYGGKFVVYQVTEKQTVPADDLASVMSTGDGEELVLYTCWPPDHINQRYLVRAVPVGIYSI